MLNKYFNKILDREETDKERAKREARAAKMMAGRERARQQQELAAGKQNAAKKGQSAADSVHGCGAPHTPCPCRWRPG